MTENIINQVLDIASNSITNSTEIIKRLADENAELKVEVERLKPYEQGTQMMERLFADFQKNENGHLEKIENLKNAIREIQSELKSVRADDLQGISCVEWADIENIFQSKAKELGINLTGE